MGKIIIHNKTDKPDVEALKYVLFCYDEISKYTFFEFLGGTRVQFVQQKTCKTFYVYGRNEVENDKQP